LSFNQPTYSGVNSVYDESPDDYNGSFYTLEGLRVRQATPAKTDVILIYNAVHDAYIHYPRSEAAAVA